MHILQNWLHHGSGLERNANKLICQILPKLKCYMSRRIIGK
jgi:hypothetical protein